MEPAGRTMLGMSRTVKDGKTLAYEFMRIEQNPDGTIDFTAKPSGQGGWSLIRHGQCGALTLLSINLVRLY